MLQRPTVAAFSFGVLGLVAASLLAQPEGQMPIPTKGGDPVAAPSRTPRRSALPSQDPLAAPQVERRPDVLGLDERITIDFKGGSLTQYVDAVRAAAAPKAVNIVVPAEVLNLQLPAIRLQNATLWTAWSAIEPAIRAQPVNVNVEVGPMSDRPGAGSSIDAVQMFVSRRSSPLESVAERSIEQVDIFSIADLVEPNVRTGTALMKVEDVLSAIETAATVAGEAKQAMPRLTFHPASGTLISRGGPGANNLVRQVIETVRTNAAGRAEQMERAKLAQDTFEQRVAQAKAEFDSARAAFDAAQRQVQEAEKVMATGGMSKADFDVFRDRAENAARFAQQQQQRYEWLGAAGVASVQAELRLRGASADLEARVAQLEREVSALKNFLGTARSAPSLGR
jgi:hypothetical protein